MIASSLPQIQVQLILLFMVAIIVTILIKYINLPYSIALVITGALIGLLQISEIGLSKELIFFLFLPPLLFEGSIHITFEDLKQNKKPIIILAFFGLGLGVFIVGFLINLLTGIPFIFSLLFGAMIMPTDPVSVLALFKEIGVPKDLSTIIEGESLFNDGVGVVIFTVVLAIIETGSFVWTATIIEFIKITLGGIIIGVSIGYLAVKILERIDDASVEVLITLIVTYLSFIIAEDIRVSGVFSVVATGLFIGNLGKKFAMSPSTNIAFLSFWDIMAFIVNTLIFLLIGTKIPLNELRGAFGLIVIAIAVVIAARSILTYLGLTLLRLVREKIPIEWQHIINWGGIHGSIPIALLLGLPKIAYFNTLSLMVYGVVFFSLVFQGLSMKWVIRKLNVLSVSQIEEQYEEDLVRRRALRAAKRKLSELQKQGEINKTIFEELDEDLTRQEKQLNQELKEYVISNELLRKKQFKVARRKILLTKKDLIRDAINKGNLSAQRGKNLLRSIDEELAVSKV